VKWPSSRWAVSPHVRFQVLTAESILDCCRLHGAITQNSAAQPFYTRGTLYIVEESWRHTNPILHIVGGGRWMCYFPIPFSRSFLSSVCPTIIKKMKTETEQKTRQTIIYLIMIIIIKWGENFVVHLDGLGDTPVCRGTPVAHHWPRRQSSSVLPYVCPSNRKQQLKNRWMDFHEIWQKKNFGLKFVGTFLFWLK
jgi:hypothetical protein